MASDQFVELSAAVVRSLPRDVPVDVAQAWITDQAGLSAALYGALTPKGISTPAPQVQQIVFLVRLDYGEPMLHKLRRLENFDRPAGSGIYDEELNGHGKTGSRLAVARLVKINEEFKDRAKVIACLATLSLRPGIAVELADCGLGGHLTHAKIGLAPVIALGDSDHNGWFGIYHESPDRYSRMPKVWRTLDTSCDKRFCPNEWWYLAFKK